MSSQGEFGVIKENEEDTDTVDKSCHAGRPDQDLPPAGFNKERRRSSFSLAKLGECLVSAMLMT